MLNRKYLLLILCIVVVAELVVLTFHSSLFPWSVGY